MDKVSIPSEYAQNAVRFYQEYPLEGRSRYHGGLGITKLKLKRNHTWRSKAGNSICVIDRGVVRFEYPSHWIVEGSEGAVHLYDRPPSVESCDLGVSIFPVSADQIRELPLEDTLRASLSGERQPYQESAIHRSGNPEMEIAWIEQRYTDPEYKRDARFRVAIVRGPVLCLISMNYWSSRAAGLERVWDEVLRTLIFGERIADPTAGPVVQ